MQDRGTDAAPRGAATRNLPGIGPSPTDPHQRVRLRSWPDMRSLAPESLPAVARICALIANRPTAAYLVAARLHESKDTVLRLLDELRGSGHVEADAGVLSLPFSASAHEPAAPPRSVGAQDHRNLERIHGEGRASRTASR
jgi:hypothetical protein